MATYIILPNLDDICLSNSYAANTLDIGNWHITHNLLRRVSHRGISITSVNTHQLSPYKENRLTY
jgi:hypothetical protein